MREILFSCQIRLFPTISAVFGIGERVGKGGALGVSRLARFSISLPIRSFPATSAAFCVGERVGSGGASGVSGLARFSIFLPNPVISCHICRIRHWREGWFGRRLRGVGVGEIFHFPAKPGHFLPHPASSGGFRRFRVETVGVRLQQQLC